LLRYPTDIVVFGLLNSGLFPMRTFGSPVCIKNLKN
jgi:hypothetical protein